MGTSIEYDDWQKSIGQMQSIVLAPQIMALNRIFLGHADGREVGEVGEADWLFRSHGFYFRGR